MVAGGVAPLSASTGAQNGTPLVFLKNNQEMYSSGCATGSTGVGAPGPGLPNRVAPGLCLSLARGSGPEGQVPVQGSTRDSQTSLPTPPELDRGLRMQFRAELCGV